MKIKAGDKVWIVPYRSIRWDRPKYREHYGTVVKVQGVWAYLKTGDRIRVGKDTLVFRRLHVYEPETDRLVAAVYESKQSYQAKVSRQRCWHALRMMLPGSPPEEVTEANIKQAAALLGLALPHYNYLQHLRKMDNK